MISSEFLMKTGDCIMKLNKCDKWFKVLFKCKIFLRLRGINKEDTLMLLLICENNGNKKKNGVIIFIL